MLTDRLDDVVQAQCDEDDTWVEIEDDDARALADQILVGYAAHFEYRDSLRRVVLTGAWEVDPSAVRAPTEPDEARLAAVAEAALSA